MSIYGYKKKWNQRAYLGPDGDKAAARASALADEKLERKRVVKARGALRRPVRAGGKGIPRAPIRQVSKRKQKVTAEYRKLAREFVRVRKSLGWTCPVVNTIPDLRDGKKYGWPISNRLNEVHHTRGRNGALLTDQRFWLALSKRGHRWVHEHIKEARAHGWVCEQGDWNKQP